MKIAQDFVLAFAIGAICRLAGIPVPAPPAIVGVLLVVAMTLEVYWNRNCAALVSRPKSLINN